MHRVFNTNIKYYFADFVRYIDEKSSPIDLYNTI